GAGHEALLLTEVIHALVVLYAEPVDVPQRSREAASDGGGGLPVASLLVPTGYGQPPPPMSTPRLPHEPARREKQSLMEPTVALPPHVVSDLARAHLHARVAPAEGGDLVGHLEAPGVEDLGQPRERRGQAHPRHACEE